MKHTRSTALFLSLFAIFCLATAWGAGCASTSDAEMARQRAETLRRQRELEREMREKLRLEAQRRALEEETKQTAQGDVKQDYFTIADTLKVSSQPLSAIAVGPDGKLLACGTARGQLKVFEIDGGIRAAATEHNEAIRSIGFSGDSRSLYTAGADETLTIWDLDSGKVRKKVRDFFSAAGAVAISGDGSVIAVGDGKAVSILDDKGAVKKKLKSSAYGIRAAQFIPGGDKIIAGSRGGLVEVWDVSGERPEHSMRRHSGAVSCIAVENSGKTALSGGADRMIVLWDLEKAKPLSVYEGHREPVTGVQFLSNKKHFASSDEGGWLFVWDIATGGILSRLQVIESGNVASLAVSADGKTLYAGLSDGTVAVLKLAEGR